MRLSTQPGSLADSEPRTVAEVIDQVQIDWSALEWVVSGLSDEQLTAPSAPDGWSIKDQLAHIGEWENALAAVLGGRPEHTGFGLTGSEIPGDIDALNDLLYQRNRALSVADVQAQTRRAHATVLAAIGKLTDAALHEPIADPQSVQSRRLLDRIAGDTYAHYAEHTAWIKSLLTPPPAA
jgi:uncharacterized protein (TIGR03083 family)